MPSFLADILDEPVKLDADKTSPYEPPRQSSHEKLTFRPTSTGGAVFNGTSADTSNYADQIDGVPSNRQPTLHSSLKSLPITQSASKAQALEQVKSENEANAPTVNGLQRFEGSEIGASVVVNGVTDRNSRHNQAVTQHNGDQVHSSRPISSGTRNVAKRTGHARAHSASAPQSPQPYSSPSSESSAAMVKLEAAPQNTILEANDTPRNNRFSSPPNLSTASSTLGGLSTASSHPGVIRLQHRHTLQVPRVATSRSSRDFSATSASDGADALYTPTTPGGLRHSLNLARRAARNNHSDLHVDEIQADDDVARWTETIRQKRASRRKRKEEEEDDRVVVGTKVDMNHVNWVIAYNMLTGIRFTVSRTNAKIDRELTDADFDARHKFSFDITGNELTPSAKYDFKFKDYAPWVFRHLRAKFRLDPADYLVSLTSKYILSELGSPGKSGSFFYFSRDYKYIIKTIHHEEHKLLRKILREYYAHIECYPNTLISQFYGLHRVKIPYGRKIHFVVMNNLFPPHRDIHQTFDLKGSTIGRNYREEDLEKNPRATLKDLNWLRRNLHLEFGSHKMSLFVQQLKRDVALLQKLKIMDYSLLVGIHDLDRGNEEKLRDKTLQVFQPGADRNNEPQPNMLTRTPSKLENARKARELRQIIKREKPVPMEQSTNRMPEVLLEERKDFMFYSDDGGFRATHEDGQPGEEIYYLGIIDCLTHYGFVKKVEHAWKSMRASKNKSQISPIPPQGYGDRFVKFITAITMTREAAERQMLNHDQHDGSSYTDRRSDQTFSRTSTDRVMEMAERQAQKSERKGMSEADVPDRALSTARSSSAERTSGNMGSTLPVVEEVGEASSTGERSGRSRGLPDVNTDPMFPNQQPSTPPKFPKLAKPPDSVPGTPRMTRSPSPIGI